MDTLVAADWPGNVRELENVIERGLVVFSGTCLPIGRTDDENNDVHESVRDTEEQPRPSSLQEWSHALSKFRKCGWMIKGKGNAADCLGLNSSTLCFA